MAKVTILVVNYNTPKFIELCLKSIHVNSITPHRVIVIDNGSTDGSLPYLKSLARSQRIHLVSRRTTLSASEHGRAFDQVLYKSGLIKTPLVCTIDSDAYVAKRGWLQELDRQRKGHFAVGYEHFRDAHLLHPACMLIDYRELLSIGRPSFALTKKNGQFFDTGIVVSQTALRHGKKLVGGRGLEALVPHRWCGTRIQRAGKDGVLDGHITPTAFAAENRKWFAKQDVMGIMSIKYT